MTASFYSPDPTPAELPLDPSHLGHAAQPGSEFLSLGAVRSLQRRCSGVRINGAVVHGFWCDLPQGPAEPGIPATHGLSKPCLALTRAHWEV